MAQTPVNRWPVPLRPDKPAGSSQITALALAVEDTLQEYRRGSIRGSWTAFQVPANAWPNRVNTLSGTGPGATVSADGITVAKAGYWLITVRADAIAAPWPTGSVIDVDEDTPGAGANAYRSVIDVGGNTGSLTALLKLAANQKFNIGVSAKGATLSCSGVFNLKWLGEE